MADERAGKVNRTLVFEQRERTWPSREDLPTDEAADSWSWSARRDDAEPEQDDEG
jgi:hypothetical protein